MHTELIKIAFFPFFLKLKYFSFSNLETMIYFTHHNAEMMVLLTGRKVVRFAVHVTW